jgi:predicted ArsR family transcriptional regulator
MNNVELAKSLSAPRREILTYIKSHVAATIGQLAEHLGISDEAARQHVVYAENQGWISGQTRRSEPARAGRPVVRYSLTEAGDHLFPKRYDELSVVLIDTLLGNEGEVALKDALQSITDAQVKDWEARLAGKSLDERIDMLRDFYFADDPFTSVEKCNGETILVERNCPFRQVAMKRPALCSTTVSTLTRLLGVRVERRQRIQNGDGRCTFHVLRHEPVDAATFRFEFEHPGEPGRDAGD